MPSPTYGPNGVKITGLKEIQRSIINLGVPREELKAAAEASAQVVLNEARSLVPVRSGKLRDSIRLTRSRSGFPQITAGNNRSGKAGVPYANPIHWGWFKRNILPQPFFTRAIGITREDVYKNYEYQLESKIRKEAAKAKSAMRMAAIESLGYTNVIPTASGYVGFKGDSTRVVLTPSEAANLKVKLSALGY